MSEEKKPRTLNISIDSSPSNWSSDILEEITRHLHTRRDIFSMRAVCSAWRCLIPIPPSGFPMKLPFPIVPNENLDPNLRIRHKGHFLLKESTIYCLEPLKKKTTKSKSKYECKSWIVKVEEMDSGKVRLKDPLSQLTIKDLERIHNEVISLLDYRVREIGKAYTLEFVQEEEQDGLFVGELRSIGIKKVVVSHYNEGEFWVLALHSFGLVGGELGVWKMGLDNWTSVGDKYQDYYNGRYGRFDDIAYYNGRFYASVYTGDTIAFDPSSLHLTEVGPRINNHGLYQYLVVSLGNLFAIHYFRRESEELGGQPYLAVYKLDEEKGKWKEVFDLEDQVIFKGDDSSYSVLATDFAAFKGKGNRIFFRDDYFEKGNFPAQGAGFYILEVQTTWSLVSILGSYSRIFWPPPGWLQAEKTS